uniref:Putative secreted protein n=1 Tax=Anopheles triannulatus TaxID=58253 RepID=A0A2M4B2D0_9DIPT
MLLALLPALLGWWPTTTPHGSHEPKTVHTVTERSKGQARGDTTQHSRRTHAWTHPPPPHYQQHTRHQPPRTRTNEHVVADRDCCVSGLQK